MCPGAFKAFALFHAATSFRLVLNCPFGHQAESPRRQRTRRQQECQWLRSPDGYHTAHESAPGHDRYNTCG